MDDDLPARARARGGLLLRHEAAKLPPAQRRALVSAQRGVLIAVTQPLTPALAVAAVDLAVTEHAWCGLAALWLHGVAPAPEVVDVAVPASRQLVLRPPARVRRLAPSLLSGTRVLRGHPVVALETAVVQGAEVLPTGELQRVVVDVLRRRMSTPPRLVAACRRGVAGSAALRAVLAELDGGALERHVRRLRAALEERGVQGLQAEVPVVSRTGARAYLDLLHRPSRTALEVDGWWVHAERGRFTADRRRDRWVLRELGVRTVRISDDEVEADLPGVVADVLPLLRPRPAA